MRSAIGEEHDKQFKALKKLSKLQKKVEAVNKEKQRELDRKAYAAVVHPFSHIAHKDTFYDHRHRNFSCRPQNVFREDLGNIPFNHRTDPIKEYSESMYRLGVFAPPRRKAAPELPSLK